MQTSAFVTLFNKLRTMSVGRNVYRLDVKEMIQDDGFDVITIKNMCLQLAVVEQSHKGKGPRLFFRRLHGLEFFLIVACKQQLLIIVRVRMRDSN